MKRLLSLLFILTLSVSFFSSCRPKEPTVANPSSSTSPATTSQASQRTSISLGGSRATAERSLRSAGGKDVSGGGKTEVGSPSRR